MLLGSAIILGGVAVGRADEQLSQPVPVATASVRTFGARCDDKADDTAAFRAAIAALPGNIIQVPPGHCRLTSMLTIDQHGTRLVGAGMGVSFLQADFVHGPDNPATLLVTASQPASGFVNNVGVQGITIQARRPDGGPGLRVVMANGLYWHDSEVLGHTIGVEIVGGYNIFAETTHINAAPGDGDTGSRYVVMRAQRRADGSFFPPRGVHATNFNWSGDNHVEHGVEVRGADGVYFANGYIGEARGCQLLINADPPEKYISTINLTGVYLDGNFKSACGAGLSGRAVDIKLTGATLANFTGTCLKLDGDDLTAVTLTGGSLMRCPTAIQDLGGHGLVVSGVSFFQTGPIRLSSRVQGPVTISGSGWIRPDGHDSSIVVENAGHGAALSASVAVSGNAFAGHGAPVRLEVPAPQLVVSGNAGAP